MVVDAEKGADVVAAGVKALVDSPVAATSLAVVDSPVEVDSLAEEAVDRSRIVAICTEFANTRKEKVL